jgi:N-methylhydantoinase B
VGEVGDTGDPIALTLLRHALEAAVDEMALALMRAAYSPNMKGSLDLSTGLCDAAGELIAQSLTLPLHLGSIPHAVAAVRATYPDGGAPGDVFILNDPYDGGTHLPDVFLIAPVFAAGQPAGEPELAGYVVCVAHHTDVGGRVAGGNACDSTEIYQEGLRLPPLKLYERGQANEGLFRLIERNVRVPRMVLGDLRAQLAACHIGRRAFDGLLERYGAESLRRQTRALVDYGERFARAQIAALPDGRYTFEDYLDDDGIDPDPIPIRVAITIQGDELTADFSGSAAQVQGAINCPIPFTRSVVYACVRCLLSQDLPNNGGYFRPIHVVAPKGTIVNPVLPAPVAARGLTGFRIANAVFGALAQVAPERVPACESGGDTGISIGGYDAARQPFVYLEFLHASWGGRPGQDGIDACASGVVNFSTTPLELLEAHYPLRVEHYGLLPDSGGPGQYRGGLGLVKEYRFLAERATLQIRADRQRFPTYGLAGGRSGALGANFLRRATRSPEGDASEASETSAAPAGPAEQGWDRLPGKTLLTVYPGDLFRHLIAGAGGWGDPFERDPASVLADVRDEKITPQHARDAYGVAIHTAPDGSTALDETETTRLRRGRGNTG